MNHQAKILTKGNLWKNVLLFSLPLVASNLLQVLFNMSDIAIVGKFAENGDAALGSVGSTATVVTLFTGFLIGIGGGINVVVATAFGSGDRAGLEKSVHTAAILAPAIGLLLTAIGMLGVRPLLEALDTKAELIDGAELYLRIYYVGMPAVAVFNFGNGVYSAVGNTRKPLVILSLSGAVNIALNLFFVVVCKFDVGGVALASVLSQYLSALLVLLSLFRSDESFSLRLSGMKLSGDKAKKILVLGVPAGLQNIVFAIANLFIQKAVNSFDPVTVEGIVAAQNADPLVYDVLAAFYMACSSFIGQSFGQKDKKSALQSYLICQVYSFALGAMLGFSLAFFSRSFLFLFTSSEAVVQAGTYRLKIMGVSYMVSSLMDCVIAASRGLGKTLIPTVFVILGSCVFRIVWVLTVFRHYGTLSSLFLLYVFSWTLTAIAEIVYFFFVFRKTTATFFREEKKTTAG
ncbi:MAG: MATE family efflux transporter [Candidatus Borkfalkiaceae bacterium]|nr:MATE family efflux transporter [Christensenellaceae bacterium]